MIQLTGAAKRFGPKTLFENLDWLVTPNERAGIVGANGTGKSTLLKILAGMDGLDAGTIVTMKGASVGYLPQEGLSLSGRTVFAECMTVFAGVLALEQEQETLAHKLSELDPASPEYAQVANRFHQAEGEFRARDGFAIEAQVGMVLSGLGFPQRQWTKRTEEFSGGWQMRIALAKLLLEKPNLLLLDEPTNHLDLEARNWLEGYLSSYPHAFVLVSHDRYFLDVTVRKLLELWNKGVHFYTGGYSRYEQQKAERLAQLEAAYANQQDRITQLEAFISRFRYQATKAKQVQSRIKELERIERIEIPPAEKTIHFRFPQPKPSGRIVAEFKNVAKSYGDQPVFAGVNFAIERGDRVALVGVNGAGKSTLIKILAGAEPLTSGEYTLGHNAQADYFAQDQYKELDVNARLIDDLGEVAPRATNTELRSILGSFLFSEDDVFKTIGVLSGGERNRYALARMLMMPPISCFWTSPPTTWTCAPRTFCLTRSRSSAARCCLSRTTATSSTSWPPASSKSPKELCKSTPETTKITSGARKAVMLQPANQSPRRAKGTNQSPAPSPQPLAPRSASAASIPSSSASTSSGAARSKTKSPAWKSKSPTTNMPWRISPAWRKPCVSAIC